MKFNFKTTAFIVVKPPSKIISQHILKNDDEYQSLLDKTVTRAYCLYFAPMAKRDGIYVATQPWQLCTDTIPQFRVKEFEPVAVPSESNLLCCDVCGREFSSTSGLTLHMKAKHPSD